MTREERASGVQDALVDPAKKDGLPPSPPGLDYPLGGRSLFIPGFLREAAAEASWRTDEDDKGLGQLLLDALLKAPIDLRVPLAERILVVGGGSMMPGFMARLKVETWANQLDVCELCDIGECRLCLFHSVGSLRNRPVLRSLDLQTQFGSQSLVDRPDSDRST